MWVVFLLAAMGFAIATLLVIYIGNKVVNAMKRDDIKLDKDINKEKTNEKEKVEAEANRLKSESITDELIRMKEAEAHMEHGFVTVNGANTVVTDK